MIYKDIDPTLLNNICIHVTEGKYRMSKRFSKITFTQSDEVCINLFHVIKTLNLTLLMFDRIVILKR